MPILGFSFLNKRCENICLVLQIITSVLVDCEVLRQHKKLLQLFLLLMKAKYILTIAVIK
jgi:hypothetical protein